MTLFFILGGNFFMKKFIEHHVGALVSWIVLLVVAFLIMPNTSSLVREKGDTKIPADKQSQVATLIQNDWGKGQSNARQVAVVFSNGDDALTKSQKKEINKTIKKLQDNKSDYHIKSITSPTDNKETRDQLVAKDKSTEIVQLMVGKKQTVEKMKDDITKAVKTSGVKTYVTGGDILTDDFSKSTEEGIATTEIIAAIFIFAVLIAVFKSPVVPVISLLTVGVSLLTSLSLVMNLVKWFNFPLSAFTQVFMVVVLFGIGTDYNILLYDQFKEELSQGFEAPEATKRARKKAGKTILYSGSSLLIGFSALGLANFSIYKSALGVAVGVAVLLLVILTLNPFFMATLGKKMFWPSKNFEGGSRSKFWAWMSRHSVARPIIALGLVALFAIPMGYFYNNNLNYDTVVELADNVPAKQGFQVIQKHYSKGTAEPSTIYIQTDKKLDKEEYIKVIDQLTRKLKKEEGIATVASLSQPGGNEVSDLYVKKQLNTVTTGMVTAKNGVKKINDGLTSASDQLAGTDMKSGLSSVQQLIDGTNKLIAGSNQIQSGSSTLASGANTLNTGANSLSTGANSLNTGANSLKTGLTTYISAVSTLNNGAGKLAANSDALRAGVSQLEAATTQLAQIKQMEPQIQQMMGLLDSLSASRSKLEALPAQVDALAAQKKQLSTAMVLISMSQSQAAKSNVSIQTAAQTILDDESATDASKKSAQSILDSSTALGKSTDTTNKFLAAIKAGVSGMPVPDISDLTALISQLPSDSEISTLEAQLSGAEAMLEKSEGQLTQLTQGLTTYINGVDQVAGELNKLNGNSSTLAGGANQLATGANSLATGANSLTSGTSKLATGANTLSSSVPALTNGLTTVRNGQQTMYSTLSGLSSKVTELTDGLNSATDGLDQIDTGIGSANSYLTGLQKSAATKEFYIPTSVLKSKTFAPALDTYLSKDKTATKLTVVLNYDPSSAKAMDKVTDLQKEVKNQLKGTSLSGAKVAIGGQTAFMADTRDVASSDFVRTAAIMLIGIGIALIFVTRSILQPLYIIGTLLLAYLSSMTLTAVVSKVALGHSELTWNTPFFAFIMIIALGVDYSIFLMMKYRSHSEHNSPSEAIMKASGIIGTVVLSAALILGGTFAALMPSGVLTLIQVAIAVIIGLLVLVILLPIVMSATVKLTYDQNSKKSTDSKTDSE